MPATDRRRVGSRESGLSAEARRAKAEDGRKKLFPVRVFNRQRREVPGRLLLSAARAAGPLRGPVDVIVVGDAEMRELNRRHLRHDVATDVITFPMNEPELWGEIVVSAETAAREAGLRGISFGRELALYVAHGVLHLRGFRDRTASEKKTMRRRERAALRRLP